MHDAGKTLTEQHFGTSRPVISRRLCEKAVDDDAPLTKAERWLFLSRFDLPGKMIACPDSLDDIQLDQVCGRPPREVLTRIVQTTTGLASVAEVVRDYWAPDRLDKLSYAALDTITRGWWTFDAFRVYAVDYDDEDYAVVATAEHVAESCRPQEAEFEEAVTDKFLHCEEEDEDEDSMPSIAESKKTEEELEALRETYLAKRAAEAAELKKALQEQLEQELKEASEDDLAAIKELRAKMEVEAAEDAKEDEEMRRETGLLEGEEETDGENED